MNPNGKAQRVTVTIEFQHYVMKAESKTYHLLIKQDNPHVEGWIGAGIDCYYDTLEDAAISKAVDKFRHGAYFTQNTNTSDGNGWICEPVKIGGSSMDERVKITVEKGWN